MRKTLLMTAAALAMAAGPALSADVEYVEEPDWAGLYIGAHAGHGWGNREGCFDSEEEVLECGTDAEEFDYDQKGWLAGGQIGFNFMPGANFLLGLEVDASLAGIDGEHTFDSDGTEKLGVGEYEWLSSAKVRAGWAMDDFLIFATGGLALSGFDYEAQSGCEFTQTRDGWLAGGGAELKVSDRASIKAEYNFMDFGKEEQACAAFIFPVYTEADAELHVVKFGFNYLIGGP
jgi:outer membrane immunogenic protein